MGGEGQPRPTLRADLWSGMLFLGLGAGIVYVGADYPLGVASRIGPGYVPRLLGLLLAALGAFLMLRSRWATEPIDATIAWRPLTLILAALIAFAFVFEASGLLPAIVATVAVANYATPENRWTTAVALGALLAVFAWALFIKGLSLPLPIWSR